MWLCCKKKKSEVVRMSLHPLLRRRHLTGQLKKGARPKYWLPIRLRAKLSLTGILSFFHRHITAWTSAKKETGRGMKNTASSSWRKEKKRRRKEPKMTKRKAKNKEKTKQTPSITKSLGTDVQQEKGQNVLFLMKNKASHFHWHFLVIYILNLALQCNFISRWDDRKMMNS